MGAELAPSQKHMECTPIFRANPSERQLGANLTSSHTHKSKGLHREVRGHERSQGAEGTTQKGGASERHCLHFS